MKDADAIVFMVDDDPSVREAIKSLITLIGVRVETFGIAQEFLKLFKKGRAAGVGAPLKA